MNPYDSIEEEYLLLKDSASQPPRKRPRTTLEPIDLKTLSNDMCKHQFRFTYPEIVRICTALKLDDTLDFGVKVDCRLALAMILYQYSFPRQYVETKFFFSVEEEDLITIVDGLADLLIEKLQDGLTFDEHHFSPENCERFSKAMSEKGALLDNIAGFIVNTKHRPNFNVIYTPDGIIGSMCGDRNDEGMLEVDILSRIATHFTTMSSDKKYALYAESEDYTPTEYLVVPFKKPARASQEKKTNTSMNKVRGATKMDSGKLIQLFGAFTFDYLEQTGHVDRDQMYVLSNLFKNIHTCLHGSPVSSRFKLDPPSLEDYINGLLGETNEEENVIVLD